MKSFTSKSALVITLLALGTSNVLASGGTIGPGFTGAWFDPAQSGHGLFIEILPDDRIQAAWFTFNPAGEQAWFLGVGSYVDNSATISAVEPVGGRWIPNFDPTQIVNNAWGTLTLTFTDADHGRVDFSSILGYGAGSMNLTRLTKVVAPNASDPSIAAKWVAASPLSVARSWHHATLLRDGRVLVTGGGNPTAELYDPVTDTWRRSANMSANFEVGAATLLRNGKVLIVGAPHSELYDPVSDTWTATGNTNESGHTATLLDDGRVLVTRGFLDDGWGDLPVVYGELYDPATGKWTRTGPLSDPGTTATLLHNGKVLVTGGLTQPDLRPPDGHLGPGRWPQFRVRARRSDPRRRFRHGRRPRSRRGVRPGDECVGSNRGSQHSPWIRYCNFVAGRQCSGGGRSELFHRRLYRGRNH